MSLTFRPLLLASLAALAVAAPGAAAATGDVTPAPSDSASSTSDLPAEAAKPAAMSLMFTRHRASLVGPRALVYVKCTGSASHACEGTLALRGAGGAHKVPFTIDRGESQVLVVPLGSDGDSLGGSGRARAVASTLQLSGSTVRTSSVLRVQ
jgi:hypothetical protein